ncbi:hypothetical protein APHAL10511_006715 [Amanita phalloides]|nr:hypothetical protein APHAL10511_006715 [Amanita phalloides]
MKDVSESRYFIHVESHSTWASTSGLPPNFRFDTAAVCSSVPDGVWKFRKPRRSASKCECPGRDVPRVPPIYGPTVQSRLSVSGFTWKGKLISNPPRIAIYGIFGLSLSDSRVHQDLHFLHNLLQNFVSPIFALALSEHGSQLHIGGFHESPAIEYHRVVKSSPHQPWQIGQLRIFVDGTIVENIETVPKYRVKEFTGATIFDSSTPYIYGPASEVFNVLHAIKHAALSHDGSNPVVYVQWEGQTKWPLKLSHSFFIREVYLQNFRADGRPWHKYAQIFKSNPDLKNWVFGTDFMEFHYLVHIATEDPQMGIGQWSPVSHANAPENIPQRPPPPHDETGRRPND